MKQIILMAFILLLFCGCSEKPLEAQRSSRDEKSIQAMWNLATKISSSEEIVGTWVSQKGDLPKGWDPKNDSYYMTFGKSGGGSFTQVTKDGATGLPFEYEIKQSKLFASTAGPPFSDWGEVRRYKKLIFLKIKDSITVYRGNSMGTPFRYLHLPAYEQKRLFVIRFWGLDN
jgi:hypothetical protein